jgi:hypothetical protein
VSGFTVFVAVSDVVGFEVVVSAPCGTLLFGHHSEINPDALDLDTFPDREVVIFGR